MKTSLSILLVVIGLESFAQSECSPKLNEIYSFDKGDVFQYQTIKQDESNLGLYHLFYSHQRNTITEKKVSGDSIIIIMDVIYYSYYSIPFYPGIGTKYLPEKRSYSDKQVIIDSTTHFLNACDSQIVYLELERGNCYSRIYINKQDGEMVKLVGGYNNLYDSISGDTLLVKSQYYKEFVQQYAEGKGLIYQLENLWELIIETELVGFVINGDTTGTVWRDSDIPTSINKISDDFRFEIYPTLVTDNNILNIASEKCYKDLKIIAVDGRLQQFKMVDQKIIRLVEASNGIYYIIAIFDDFIVQRMFIKM